MQNKLKRTIIGTLDDKYYLYEKLGFGASCIAYLATPIDDDTKQFAAKILFHKNDRHNTIFEQETKILSRLNVSNNEASKNIIYMENYKSNAILRLFTQSEDKPQDKFRDISEEELNDKPKEELETVDYICLALAGKGELFDYLKCYSKGFSEDIARFLFSQILNGVNYCHQMGFIHRDLKLENILFDNDWIIKISDFGLSSTKRRSKYDYDNCNIVGTDCYLAPELAIKKQRGSEIKQQYYGQPADVYSLGILLFTMVVAKYPFSIAIQTDEHSRFDYLVNKDHEQFWEEYEENKTALDLSNEFKSLIFLMLSVDPCERPSMAEILEHAWMKLPTPPKSEVDEELIEREIMIKRAKNIDNELIRRQKDREEQEMLKEKNNRDRESKILIQIHNNHFSDEVKRVSKKQAKKEMNKVRK